MDAPFKAKWLRLNKPKASKGFTLIEIIIVVLILGILATLSLPTYKSSRYRIRTSHMLQKASQIRRAAEYYVLENGWPLPVVQTSPPFTAQGFSQQTGMDVPEEGEYFTFAIFFHGPGDPWEPNVICIHAIDKSLGTDPVNHEILWTQVRQDGGQSWHIVDRPSSVYVKYLKKALPNAMIHSP